MKLLSKYFFPHDAKPDHFKALDGLRGIAVLIVLLSHSSNEGLMFHEWLNFQRIGKVGVYLFFVLSAYLLDRQIALAYIKGRASKSYWKNYFLRRFLRIYPLFALALLIYFTLNSLGLKTVIDSSKDIALHMLLLKGESIFWSIPVEFKYYFISPLIMWACHKYLKWNPTQLIAFFVLMVLISIGVELMFHLPLISTFRYFPIFLVGTVISIFELLYQDRLRKILSPKAYNLIGTVTAIGLLLSVPFYFKQLFGREVNFHHSIFYFPYACAWGLLLLSAKYGKGLLRLIFEFKPLRFIGSISFSMYLFHMPILLWVKGFNLPKESKVYVFFILAILFSAISYLAIERPLSKIRIKVVPGSKQE